MLRVDQSLPGPAEEMRSSSSAWRIPITYDGVAPFALIADVAIIFLASLSSGIGYHLFRFGATGEIAQFLALGAVVAAILVPPLALRHQYEATILLNLKRQITGLMSLWSVCFVFLFGVAFALKIGDIFSRGAVVSFMVLGLLLLISSRLLWCWAIKGLLQAGRLQGRKIALVTQPSLDGTSALADVLERHGFQVVQRLILPATQQVSSDELQIQVSEILRSARGSEVEEIFISADWRDSQELVKLVEHMKLVPLRVRFIPDAPTAALIRRSWHEVGASLAVDIQRAPLHPAERFLKRSFDVLIAGAGVLLLSPLMLITALAVRLDTPGPIFFRQSRRGFNGREFTILKFRSMVVLENGPMVQQATREDARVTRCGYWLRRTSLDELPQLFNVLSGKMSIVGPRPHAVAHDNHYDRLIGRYALRHHVKPGLTGWAQVNGYRGETPTIESMARRVDFDLWYIDNWSLWLDALIVMRTVFEVARSRNAY